MSISVFELGDYSNNITDYTEVERGYFAKKRVYTGTSIIWKLQIVWTNIKIVKVSKMFLITAE